MWDARVRDSEWSPFIQEFLQRIDQVDCRQDEFRQRIQHLQLQLVQTRSTLQYIEQIRLRDRTELDSSSEQVRQLNQALEQSEAFRAQLENKVLEHGERYDVLDKQIDRLQHLLQENEEMARTIDRQEERLQEQARLLARYYNEDRNLLEQPRGEIPGSMSGTASEPVQAKVTKRRKRAPRKVKVENQGTMENLGAVVLHEDLEKNGNKLLEGAEV